MSALSFSDFIKIAIRGRCSPHNSVRAAAVARAGVARRMISATCHRAVAEQRARGLARQASSRAYQLDPGFHVDHPRPPAADFSPSMHLFSAGELP